MIELNQNQETFVMREAFQLKAQMIRWITVATLGFCLTKFTDFALAYALMNDEFAKARARCMLQWFDFLWIAIVMIVCRARKEWPLYFTLSMSEAAMSNQQE